MNKQQMNVYREEGRTAYYDDKLQQDNPYLFGDKAQCWRDGWIAAQSYEEFKDDGRSSVGMAV